MATYYVDGVVGNDANAGTSPGAGNAWATIAHAVATAVAGDVVYVKASATYTQTSSITMAASGNGINGPITFIGYTSVITDGGQATITTATDSTVLVAINGKNNIFWQNFVFSNTAAVRNIGFGSTAAISYVWTWINCVFDGFTRAVDGNNVSTYYVTFQNSFIGCTIKNCSSVGIFTGSSLFDGCLFSANATAIQNAGSDNHVFIVCRNCVFYANTSPAAHQVDTTDCALFFSGCVFHSNSSDGIKSDASNSPMLLALENNIFWSNGGYGVNVVLNVLAGQTIPFNRNNAYGSNTSGPRNNLAAGSGDVTLTADPCVNAAGGNFALNNTAGGGAACRAAGFPGVAVIGTGYTDIGALQHQDSGGGGGSGGLFGSALIKGLP